MLISQITSEDQLTTVITALDQLKKKDTTALGTILNCRFWSRYQANLLLLNIPNLGVEITTQIVSAVTTDAMDGADFEENQSRAQKYGVDLGNPSSTTFPFWMTNTTNRNVYLDLSRLFNLKHLAILAGISLTEMLTSSDESVVALRELATHIQPLNQSIVMGNDHVRPSEIRPLHLYQDLNSDQYRFVTIIIPNFYETSGLKHVTISVRDKSGKLIGKRRPNFRSWHMISFDYLPKDQDLTFSAIGKTFAGETIEYLPLVLKPKPFNPTNSPHADHFSLPEIQLP
jgi:hypothetical protein